jgi:hypothetical protein
MKNDPYLDKKKKHGNQRACHQIIVERITAHVITIGISKKA